MSKWEIFVNVLEKNGRFGVNYPKDLTLFELDLWEKFRNDEPIASSSSYGFGHSSYKSKSKKKSKSKSRSRTRSRGSKKGKRRVSRNSYKKKSK